MWCLNASKKLTPGSYKPPVLNGVGPSCIGLPGGHWPTTLDFLLERFSGVSRTVWCQRMAQGQVVDEYGQLILETSPFVSHKRVYYYREVPHEPHIPFEEVVLFQDDHLVVVDKPHFLPVVPSGGYLNETVLVRLKKKLGIDTLVPVHRIDRDTAGLVMFSKQPQSRASYHALFSQHDIKKTYEAIAPWRAELTFPLTRASRIEEAGHFMLQHEVVGPVNAITDMAVLEVRGAFARYALSPVSGKRHQLRVHMAALGLPIVGDGLYPILTPEGQIDYDNPLRLLAKSVEFTDPLTGELRRFESQRHLNWA
jgi:tRNA pseudouridine32 synthase/23S rRNA pseudouridine746 synthase